MNMNPMKMASSAARAGDKARKKMSKKGWDLSKEGRRRTEECGLVAGLTTGFGGGCPDSSGIGGGSAYSGDSSWEGGVKFKRGGLVTQGSKKELSRLTGKFKIT